MSTLGFGQPVAGVWQMAYVVEDIQASMRRWIEELGVGPWFLLPHFTGERGDLPRRARPRATPRSRCPSRGTCRSSSSSPNDDKPSVYREAIEARGYGFHHFGIGALDYDADLARHLEQGHELAFEAWVPTGGRVGYVDTTAELPGYVELIEVNDSTDGASHALLRGVAGVGRERSRPAVPLTTRVR